MIGDRIFERFVFIIFFRFRYFCRMRNDCRKSVAQTQLSG